MKKWLFTGLVIVLLLIAGVIYQIFYTNHVYLSQGNQKAIAAAKKYASIQTINGISIFHGKHSYHVINAELKNHKKVYIWVPEKAKKQIVEKPVSDGLTKKQIMNHFNQLHYSVNKITNVQLGMIDQTPVWEIVFVDSNREYNYVYLNFTNGEEVEQILHI